ncbi:LamG-like jellyroll fold domain-containing protein [Flavobacterium yafengii]|uniref:T9SS type A sorting domain-containing protein n=1 Tax=Flavobacterium yafengii TaxID=3041253 RepID=UPI0024A95623|nr:LamG-like jellyroll fold domain-containing protein [Flavobacterium yafengii]MDI5887260.1 T9SS type A sorting domain-containing protein [Flavobacterium yafengii]
MNRTILFTKKTCFTLAFLFLVFLGYSQSQTYNTPGTYTFTVPAGVTSINVQAWGAGGGGSSRVGAGGGGGGGAFGAGTITGLTGGTTITINVGSGGTPGNAGGISSAGSISINGGGSNNSTTDRTGGTGGTASSVIGFVTSSYAGGSGGNAAPSNSGGNNEAGGGGGGSALTTLVPSATAGATGGTSQTLNTAGGTGTATGGLGASADGTPDATAGGYPGGGGGSRGEGGGASKNGGDGQVILTWTCSGVNVTNFTTNIATNPCKNTSATVTVNSNSLATGTYTVYYNLSGANTATAQSVSMAFNGTTDVGTFSTIALANAGSTTITITSVGCANTTAGNTATTTVVEPTANAGSALSSICQGSTSVTLGGSFGGSATSAIWSDGGVGGTFTNNTGSTPNTTTWTPPAAYTGTATLTLTTSGGACGITNASKTQVVSIGPTTATVGNFQTIYSTLVSASLGGNTPSVGTGAWSKISGPGTVTFSSGSSGNSTATVTLNGAYVFRWTITGSCGSSTADITVTYLPFKDPEYTISYENFDNSNGGWTSSGTTGAWGYTNTASSVHRGEGNFWAVNTTSSRYPNGALTYLTGPTISTSGYTNVKLFIDVRYKTDLDTNDGMQIQYSTNNGGTWAVLGGVASSWYTASNVNALTGALGWNSDSSLYGSPSTPVAAPSSQFLEKSIQTSVLDNISQLKFRAVFASNASTTDAGVAIDNIIIKGDPTTPFTNPTNGPGSVNSNLKLWLKSNIGTSTAIDGAALATWNDQAFDNNSEGIIGNSPVFRNNATRNINFNPVVDFTAASSQLMKGKGGYWSQDYYVVIKTNGAIDNTAATRQVPISGRLATNSFQSDGTALGLGNFTLRYTNEMVSHNVSSVSATPSTATQSYGRAYTSSTDSYNQQTIIFNIKTNSSGTGTEIYKNGKRIDTTEGQAFDQQTGTFTGTLNFSDFNNLQYNLGVGRFTLGGNVASYLDGRMTEVVSYSTPKTALEQQKIQSYLAIKNGVTLHAAGSTTTDDLCDENYLDSSGSTIWDAVTNSGYNYDIAGIGRDDNTLLNQKQSKTENPTADISMGLGDLMDVNSNNTNTFDTDKKFLVWGNNHGTLAAQPQIVVNISSGITSPSSIATDVSFVSVGRTWKVVETGGNVPTAKVSIPSTMLTATITPPGDYLMFISDTPVFNPTAEYRVMTVNGSNLETTYDFNGTKYITFGYAPERTFVRCIKFDGVDDYLDAGKVLNLNTSFTVSAWVNRNSTNKTILSKRNSTFTQGYDLSINTAGRAEMSWMVGATKHTITSNVVIPSGKWHHIGVIYNGGTTTARMYIDGVTSVSNTSMPNVPATTQSFLIAAADDVTPTSLFNGSIDEVRVWNVALTEAQFRYVMNQEILSNTTLTNGVIVPNTITLNDISTIPWTNLSAYYPMSTYTYTNAKDISNNRNTAALRNLTTVDLQTAPLPYESAANGNWETVGTWTNSSVQDLPYSISIEDTSKTIDWNIVRTSHNITSAGNKTVLGLFVNSNTLSATNDSKIEVSHYLKLDGKIDLVGRSQLVQKLGSDLDATSSGSLERDQQGQANKYNYNYWSSPVGAINTTTNNNTFTVAGVLRDGTNAAAPGTINWINGYDGATSPFSLARFWIYKFDNLANNYANWTQIGETGLLSASKGFTLKGPGTSGTQNLTFLGKPNNGTINNTVGADQLLLVGNPYPSALDANKFINDNIGSIETATTNPAIDGALYFWEHYATNSSHELAAYQGGYGIRNLSGGVAPSATGVDFISGSGTASKLAPNQFIPVGQGFFIIGKVGTGGTVTFNNSQREFITETNASSQTTYKIPVNPKTDTHWTDNSNTPIEKDTHKKIRLGFNVMDKTFHRQVLLAFMDEKANSEMNDGYDAFNIDDSPSDMYLLNGENELAIQGEGYFDEDASFPIAVRTEAPGKVSFGIDALENFDQNQNIFIYDKETDTYNSIKNKLYEVELPQGYFTDRFSLRFTDKTLGVKDVIYENTIQVVFTRSNNVLNITNGATDNTVVAVSLFNIQGKLMSTWDVSEKEQTNIKIPIQNKTSGVYIVKLKTSKGNINKKIIIK